MQLLKLWIENHTSDDNDDDVDDDGDDDDDDDGDDDDDVVAYVSQDKTSLITKVIKKLLKS